MAERVVKVRWKCAWCRRSFASGSYALRHERDCGYNPAVRGCLTCTHFVAHPCCDVPSDDCGCKGLNLCNVGAFESWSYNDHETRTPDPDGWWQHTVDFKRSGCSSWADG